jgi:hypothetical protein
MRKRDQIERESRPSAWSTDNPHSERILGLILEVLLDIRDQLQEHALTDAEKLKKLMIEGFFHGEPK